MAGRVEAVAHGFLLMPRFVGTGRIATIQPRLAKQFVPGHAHSAPGPAAKDAAVDGSAEMAPLSPR